MEKIDIANGIYYFFKWDNYKFNISLTEKYYDMLMISTRSLKHGSDALKHLWYKLLDIKLLVCWKNRISIKIQFASELNIRP